jgi:hypothetical protein
LQQLISVKDFPQPIGRMIMGVCYLWTLAVVAVIAAGNPAVWRPREMSHG